MIFFNDKWIGAAHGLCRCVLQQGSAETGSDLLIPCCRSVTGSGWKAEDRGEGRGYLSNDIIATELVFVHDSDNYGGLPQHVGRHVKGEGLVENGVQATLHYHRLLLFHTLVLVHQPHFNVRICGERKAPHHHKTLLITISADLNMTCVEWGTPGPI